MSSMPLRFGVGWVVGAGEPGVRGALVGGVGAGELGGGGGGEPGSTKT